MELQTMPLRFRVWDKIEKKFVDPESFYIDGNGSLNVRVLTKIDEGTEHESLSYRDIEDDFDRFVISNDTGCVDDEEQPLFVGDIVESKLDGNTRTVIEYNGHANVARFPGWLEDSLFCSSFKFHKVGNVWQDKGLLDE